MKYIILKGEGNRDFIAEEQEDGTYKKIAQLFDNVTAGHIVGYANVGYDEHLKIIRSTDAEKCDSWRYIDGGNDRAVCTKIKHHLGNHGMYGVPDWTDKDNQQSVAMDAEDY